MIVQGHSLPTLRREIVLAADWGMGGGMALADHKVSQGSGFAFSNFSVHFGCMFLRRVLVSIVRGSHTCFETMVSLLEVPG